MDAHQIAVSAISQAVKAFHSTSTPFRIYHGSTLSTRPSARTKANTVDISPLKNILSINQDTKTCLVEPNVPMDALVTATMASGFLPPVVMELPNITVGGGFAGTSGESSSFRYGTFDCTVRSIEVVLGNGDVVTARRGDAETQGLLFGSAGACGTLGIVTLLELEVVPARKYVRLTYWPVQSTGGAVEVLRRFEGDAEVDFVDGIMFSLTEGTVMVGKLSDEVSGPIRTFDRASDPWFYLHAQHLTSSSPSQPVTETIPTPSYLFRYDRSVFWSGALAFKFFHTPCNRLTRFLLDPFMRTRVVNHALHRSGLAKQGIIQDLGVPYAGVEEFVTFSAEAMGFWPLWLCPVKSPRALGRGAFSVGRADVEMEGGTMLDIGVWGIGPSDAKQFIRLNRVIERKVRDLGGLKCLYAHAYYTEDEFWQIYDEEEYLGLRKKWKAEGLPSVWDKVKVDLQGVDAKDGELEQGDICFKAWKKGSLSHRIRGKGRGVVGVLSAMKYIAFGGDFVLKKAR